MKAKVIFLWVLGLLVSSGFIFANDLRIESYEANWLKNGSELNSFESYTYDDEIQLQIKLKSSWLCSSSKIKLLNSCDPKPEVKPGSEIAFQARISIESYLTQFALTPVATFSSKKTFNVNQDELAYRYFDSSVQNISTLTKKFTFDTNQGSSFSTWIAEQFNSNRYLKIKLEIDHLNQVPETNASGETNNDSIQGIYSLAPLSGNIYYGLAQINLDNKNSITLDNINCGNGSGLNSIYPNIKMSANMSWQASEIQNQWDEKTFSVTNHCFEYKLNNDSSAFDLFAKNQTQVNEITGEFSGLNVSLNAEFDENGVTPIEFSMDLPEGHTIHKALDNDTTRPNPRGSNTLKLIGVSPSALNDVTYDNLSDISTLLSEKSYFLATESLPFSLKIKDLTLDENGVSGKIENLHYHYNYEFHGSDNRKNSNASMASNDLYFRYFAGFNNAGDNFTLSSEGISGLEAFFNANFSMGRTHFPKMKTFVTNAFGVSVDNSEVKIETPINAIYNFKMNPGCEGCGDNSALGSNSFLFTTAFSSMAEDGALANKVEAKKSVQWGNYSSEDSQRVFKRIGDDLKKPILYIPGSQALNTGGENGTPVYEYLLGMREIDSIEDIYFPSSKNYNLSSNEARVGNHFMSGLTYGPEIYRNADGEPELDGIGEILSDTSTSILFGGVEQADKKNVVTNEGTKYVVRESGLTGVFNTDDEDVVSPTVYDYKLDLTSFAFRQTSDGVEGLNVIDDYSWIDGKVSIGNKGDFHVVFDSMHLECSGQVSSARVVKEACDGDDNNYNDIEDENCNQHYLAWKTPIDLLNMEFKGNENQCSNDPRTLWVESKTSLYALNEPLQTNVNWSSGGEVLGVTVTGRNNLILDRPDIDSSLEEYKGFKIQIGDNIQMKTPNNNNDDGYFAFDSTVGVPFWQALDTNIRISNSLDYGEFSAEKTVVLQEDFTNADYNKTNEQLSDELKNRAGNAEYSWGNTGLDVSLPVYYDTNKESNEAPRFLGKKLSKDLKVIDVNAGIDYIDPKKTKVSFGASADFEKLTALEVNLKLDTTDPKSIKKADNFLCGLGSPQCGGDTGPLGKTIAYVHTKLGDLNEVANSGMDKFIRNNVESLIDSIVIDVNIDGENVSIEPFEIVSKELNKLITFPNQIETAITSEVLKINTKLLNPIDLRFHQDMTSLYLDLPNLLNSFELAINQSENGVLTLEQKEQFKVGFEGFDQLIQRLNSKFDDVKSNLQKANEFLQDGKNDVNDLSTRASTSLNNLVTYLQELQDKFPDPNEDLELQAGQIDVSEVIDKVVTIKDKIKDAIEAVSWVVNIDNGDQAEVSLDIESLAEVVSSLSGVNLDAATIAAQHIRTIATDLNRSINIIENDFENAINDLGHEGLYTQAWLEIESIKDNAKALETAISDVNNYIQNQTVINSIETAILDMHTKVTLVQNKINEIHEEFIQPVILEAYTKAEYPVDYYEIWKEKFAVEHNINGQVIKIIDIDAIDWDNLDKNNISHSFVLEAFIDEKLVIERMLDDFSLNLFEKWSLKIDGTEIILPGYNSDDLKAKLVDAIMNTDAIESINRAVHNEFTEIVDQINDVTMVVFDQVNQIFNSALQALNDKANEILSEATADIANNLPLKSAKVDGFATIQGKNLERLHIGALWTMKGDEDESSSTYEAALDISSWSANGKGASCGTANADDKLDAIISAYGVPFSLGTSGSTLRKIYVGFMLSNSVLNGIYGGLAVDGTVDFEAFQLYDLAFDSGIGTQEVYLGTTAGAIFEDLDLKTAFLVGNVCDNSILESYDPQVAEFIEYPNGGNFKGVYTRGSASVPVYANGCALTVGVSADVGAWFLIGNPNNYGGLVGGGAFGKVLCVGALRGQVTVMGQKTADGFSFRGDGFGVAGGGFDCDPGTWTTVRRSRKDSWCGTGDASFTATYKNGWDVGSPKTSAIH